MAYDAGRERLSALGDPYGWLADVAHQETFRKICNRQLFSQTAVNKEVFHFMQSGAEARVPEKPHFKSRPFTSAGVAFNSKS